MSAESLAHPRHQCRQEDGLARQQRKIPPVRPQQGGLAAQQHEEPRGSGNARRPLRFRLSGGSGRAAPAGAGPPIPRTGFSSSRSYSVASRCTPKKSRTSCGAPVKILSPPASPQLVHEVDVFHYVRGAEHRAATVREVAQQFHELEFRGRDQGPRSARPGTEPRAARAAPPPRSPVSAGRRRDRRCACRRGRAGRAGPLFGTMSLRSSPVGRGAGEAQPRGELQRLRSPPVRACTISSCGTNPQRFMPMPSRHVHAIHQHRAGPRARQPAQHRQQRRFPRAARPDDPGKPRRRTHRGKCRRASCAHSTSRRISRAWMLPPETGVTLCSARPSKRKWNGPSCSRSPMTRSCWSKRRPFANEPAVLSRSRHAEALRHAARSPRGGGTRRACSAPPRSQGRGPTLRWSSSGNAQRRFFRGRPLATARRPPCRPGQPRATPPPPARRPCGTKAAPRRASGYRRAAIPCARQRLVPQPRPPLALQILHRAGRAVPRDFAVPARDLVVIQPEIRLHGPAHDEAAWSQRKNLRRPTPRSPPDKPWPAPRPGKGRPGSLASMA